MIPKRLIYHFYLDDNWETNPIYGVHQYLLKKYHSIFDEAIFIIATNDINNIEEINKAKKFLIDTSFSNIVFRVEENNALYEVSTFEKYILNELDNLGGMTFFAHTKGTNDFYESDKDRKAVLKWILALYYLSLEFYKEGEKYMFGTNSGCCFFGGLLGLFDEEERIDKHFPKNNAMYVGTYYWLNCKEIYWRYMEELPKVYNRFYAENFPGSICKPCNYELYSHNYMMLPPQITDNVVFRNEGIDGYIYALLNEKELETFNVTFNKMIENLKLEEYI